MAKLEIITGPMFSGKSEELIRRLNRAVYKKKNILVIKPAIDTRTDHEIASREKKSIDDKEFKKNKSFPAHPVKSIEEALMLIEKNEPNILAIDEAQFFFDDWFMELIEKLLEKHSKPNFKIIISGLDMDARKKPFGKMPELMARANKVTKLTAICFFCQKKANLTCKIAGSGQKQIEIGDVETYKATCRACHRIPSE